MGGRRGSTVRGPRALEAKPSQTADEGKSPSNGGTVAPNGSEEISSIKRDPQLEVDGIGNLEIYSNIVGAVKYVQKHQEDFKPPPSISRDQFNPLGFFADPAGFLRGLSKRKDFLVEPSSVSQQATSVDQHAKYGLHLAANGEIVDMAASYFDSKGALLYHLQISGGFSPWLKFYSQTEYERSEITTAPDVLKLPQPLIEHAGGRERIDNISPPDQFAAPTTHSIPEYRTESLNAVASPPASQVDLTIHRELDTWFGPFYQPSPGSGYVLTVSSPESDSSNYRFNEKDLSQYRVNYEASPDNTHPRVVVQQAFKLGQDLWSQPGES